MAEQPETVSSSVNQSSNTQNSPEDKLKQSWVFLNFQFHSLNFFNFRFQVLFFNNGQSLTQKEIDGFLCCWLLTSFYKLGFVLADKKMNELKFIYLCFSCFQSKIFSPCAPDLCIWNEFGVVMLGLIILWWFCYLRCRRHSLVFQLIQMVVFRCFLSCILHQFQG